MFFKDWYFKRNPNGGSNYNFIDEFIKKNSIEEITNIDYDTVLNNDHRFSHIKEENIFMGFEIECDHYHHYQSFCYICIYNESDDDIFVYIRYRNNETKIYEEKTYKIDGLMIIKLKKFIDKFVKENSQ